MRKIRQIALLLMGVAAGASECRGQAVTFKPVEFAVLKIDERPARIWDVYLSEKRKELILVRLGLRFLLLDVQARELFELAPEALQEKDKMLVWNETERAPGGETGERKTEIAQPAKRLLASEEWTIRNVGPARRIRVRIRDEGRLLEIQLPITPDLRRLY